MQSPRRTAIITGTQGISRAIAQVLAKEHGYTGFVLLYRSNRGRAEETQDYLQRTYGAQVINVQADLATQSGCAAGLSAAFSAVEASFGNQLTALVHSGGCYLPADAAAFDGYYHLYPSCFSQAVERALQLMQDGEGKILAVSSPGCNLSMAPVVDYPAGHAKAALEYLVRMFAAREAKRRINVNCVIPGVTDTAAWTIPREAVTALAAKISPMAALLQPEDIAHAVSFLCGPQGRFVTGVCLPVDGGLHLARRLGYDLQVGDAAAAPVAPTSTAAPDAPVQSP